MENQKKQSDTDFDVNHLNIEMISELESALINRSTFLKFFKSQNELDSVSLNMKPEPPKPKIVTVSVNPFTSE